MIFGLFIFTLLKKGFGYLLSEHMIFGRGLERLFKGSQCEFVHIYKISVIGHKILFDLIEYKEGFRINLHAAGQMKMKGYLKKVYLTYFYWQMDFLFSAT
jgi:hypothetical protein